VRRVLRTSAFAVLTAAGTVAAGWWTVPILAAIWVRVLPSDRRPGTAIVGAAVGWGALVALGWLHGHIPALARTLSAALGLPAWGFLTATVLFPALLAGAAALLVKPASIG
jgi:hypothetical protein